MAERNQVTQSIHFVRAQDNCQIAVRMLRESRSVLPPVLAIHALAMDGSMWMDVVSFLSSDVTVLAIDCRGHGRSGKPRGPYSTELFSEDLACVMDQCGYPRAILAGCSMGGTTAMAFAGRYPERVEGLCLFDTTAWYGEGAAARWEQRAQTALRQGMSALTAFQLERWFSPEFQNSHGDMVTRALAIFLANNTEAYAACCRMLGSADERQSVANYRGPAAVTLGEDDHATPLAMAEDIRTRLPQARLRILPKARHFTPYEKPREVSEEIERAIKLYEASVAGLPGNR